MFCYWMLPLRFRYADRKTRSDRHRISLGTLNEKSLCAEAGRLFVLRKNAQSLRNKAARLVPQAVCYFVYFLAIHTGTLTQFSVISSTGSVFPLRSTPSFVLLLRFAARALTSDTVVTVLDFAPMR